MFYFHLKEVHEEVFMFITITMELCYLYHFNYSNRTVQSGISFTKITNRMAKIFQLSIAKKMDQDTKLQLYQEQVFNLIFTTLSY